MIVRCEKCMKRFDDEFRITICPHETFAANDGENNFAHHPESCFEKGLDLTWLRTVVNALIYVVIIAIIIVTAALVVALIV